MSEYTTKTGKTYKTKPGPKTGTTVYVATNKITGQTRRFFAFSANDARTAAKGYWGVPSRSIKITPLKSNS